MAAMTAIRRRLRRVRTPLLVATIAVIATACAFDLGTLGGSTSFAADINDQGVIVGTADNIYGQTHAFKLVPGSLMADLHALSSGRSEAKAINESNVVVGTSGVTQPDGTVVNHAVRWNADNSLTDLGTVPGASAVATDINDAGVIVGTLTFNELDTRAFVWSPANPTLTQLPGIGTPYTSAAAINNSRQIVGTAIIGAIPNVQGILWNPGVSPGSYVPVDLGKGTGVSAANDINDGGTIVGHWATELGSNFQTAVRWTAAAHAMTDLPGGGFRNDANAINAAGIIVGTSSTYNAATDQLGSRAWRLEAGAASPADMGSLGGPSTNASGINSAGVAVGTGTNGSYRYHAARFDLPEVP
jgi:probable HAF family extracellular repeat protein